MLRNSQLSATAILTTAAFLPACIAQSQPAWRAAEAPLLADHVQLTSRNDFIKAGEAYFSPDAKWVIFQAIPVPAGGGGVGGVGGKPDDFYSMYVAKVVIDPAGKITGIETPIRVSEPGSANTCGWFHPTQPYRILFGSTLVPPAAHQKAGFQVGNRKYQWMFPEETEVVTRTVPQIAEPFIDSMQKANPELKTSLDRTNLQITELQSKIATVDEAGAEKIRAQIANLEKIKAKLEGLVARANPLDAQDVEKAVPLFQRERYDAECSFSRDGRFVLYAHVRPGAPEERADADIWIYDTQTGQQHEIVVADGYDGGPFFSPDNKRICYRSDRAMNDLLQLYVADLVFDDQGVPTGSRNEIALTNNEHVNWCPYWHKSGKYLVYGTSEVGHTNYEIFAVEVPPSGAASSSPPRRRRVTNADGADVLPAFSNDGKWMMWTAQRGPMAEGETKPSSQLWVASLVSAPGGMNDLAGFFAAAPAPASAPATPPPAKTN